MLGNYLEQTTSADDILDRFFLGALRVKSNHDNDNGRPSQNNRDNVLFSSLLIGLSVDFCEGGTCTCVWCVRASVRACVRAFMCVLL